MVQVTDPDRPAMQHRGLDALGMAAVTDAELDRDQTEELIVAIEWAPDETQLAVVAVAKDGVKIRAVNLGTGAWRTLATLGPLDLSGREADVLAFKALSWTQ